MAAVSEASLDCRGLLCPFPVIRIQDRIAKLAPGSRLEAICTDPGVLRDVPAWCRINGHAVLRADSEDGEFRLVIRVGDPHE